MPLTRWSLERLSAYLAEQGVQISSTHLWRLLEGAGLSFQRTRSWKASPDPDYETKAARVLDLYAHPPADGVQDGLSANWTPDIRAFAQANNIELVATPTYASYLNRIESHFRPIQEFVFNNADSWTGPAPSARWPTTSPIATAATTTAASPPSNVVIGLARDVIPGQTFGADPLAPVSGRRRGLDYVV